MSATLENEVRSSYYFEILTDALYFVRGRPPDFPQRDSRFRCFLVVVLPPRLPMQRGQISSVSLWTEQRGRRGTARYSLQNVLLCQLQSVFFRERPPSFPHADRSSWCLDTVAFPPAAPIHLGQITFVCGCLGHLRFNVTRAETI